MRKGEGYHATSVLSLTWRDPARAGRLDFKRFNFGCAVGRVLINAGIGRMSALGANRTGRDGSNDVNDPKRTLAGVLCCGAKRVSALSKHLLEPVRCSLLGGWRVAR